MKQGSDPTLQAPPQADGQDIAARVAGLANQLVGLAEGRGRRELVGQLQAELARRDEPAAAIVVAGETKRGKSSLINALLGWPDLSPVDADVATGTHVVFRHATGAPAARIIRDGQAESIPLEELEDWASITGNPGNEKGVQAIEVELDSPFLARGLTLIDTPGVGGLDAAHAQITKAALTTADALLFVVDPVAPLSEPELRFLREVTDRIDTVWFALTKKDAFQGWRQILEDDRALLARTRYADSPFFPVSSTLKLDADALVGEGDEALARELRDESGFDELEGELVDRAAGKARSFRIANVLRLSEAVFRRLDELERAAIAGAKDDPRLRGELEKAQKRAAEFRTTRMQGGRALERKFRRVQNRVDTAFNDALRDLRHRYEEKISARREGALAQELDTELRAIDANLGTTLVEHTAQVVDELERELKLAGLGDIEIGASAALDSDYAIELPIRPASGAGWQGVVPLAAPIFLGSRLGMLGGALGLAIPGLSVIGVALGGLLAGASWRKRKDMQNQQQAHALLREAIDWARAKLQPLLRERAWDAKEAIEEELLAAIERREAELQEAIGECNRVASADAKSKQQERRQAQTRLQQLAKWRPLVDALRAEAASARPALVASAPPSV